MGITNVSSGGRAAYGDQWKAYEALPPTFRAIIRDSAFLWATTTCLARHRKAQVGYRNPAEFADTVRRWNDIENARMAKKGLVMKQRAATYNANLGAPA